MMKTGIKTKIKIKIATKRQREYIKQIETENKWTKIL